MASYDSDSSGAEDDAYTETNVLLGYASKEPTDDTISQLGGHPTWLDNTRPPPGHLAKCKVCNGLLSLLLQLNGDLPERFPGHERRLYLLGCRKRTCRRREGSVRGFRAIRAKETHSKNQDQKGAATASSAQPAPTPSAPEKERQDIGAALFGVKASSATLSSPNPFSTSSSSSSIPANPFASASSLAAKPAQRPSNPEAPPAAVAADLPETFASKARISTPERTTQAPAQIGPVEPWPPASSFPSDYAIYYLDADYESLEAGESVVPANARVDMDIDGEGSGDAAGSSNADDKAAFESVMDKTFQRFADRLAQNPEQVLRYEFGGQPLLYSKTDAVGRLLDLFMGEHGGRRVQTTTGGGSRVPRCQTCGSKRMFEMQLTPHAITELEADDPGIDGMEWGTVILQVCSSDCSPPGLAAGELGYVEEWVGVQWEEVVKK